MRSAALRALLLAQLLLALVLGDDGSAARGAVATGEIVNLVGGEHLCPGGAPDSAAALRRGEDAAAAAAAALSAEGVVSWRAQMAAATCSPRGTTASSAEMKGCSARVRTATPPSRSTCTTTPGSPAAHVRRASCRERWLRPAAVLRGGRVLGGRGADARGAQEPLREADVAARGPGLRCHLQERLPHPQVRAATPQQPAPVLFATRALRSQRAPLLTGAPPPRAGRSCRAWSASSARRPPRGRCATTTAAARRPWRPSSGWRPSAAWSSRSCATRSSACSAPSTRCAPASPRADERAGRSSGATVTTTTTMGVGGRARLQGVRPRAPLWCVSACAQGDCVAARCADGRRRAVPRAPLHAREGGHPAAAGAVHAAPAKLHAPRAAGAHALVSAAARAQPDGVPGLPRQPVPRPHAAAAHQVRLHWPRAADRPRRDGPGAQRRSATPRARARARADAGALAASTRRCCRWRGGTT
eukprot:scaffold1031_cov461-Prasinococcus_capsulatus_cf.AAC.6